MNKKAVELSINFLVVTILSLVVLSLGIVLLRNIFSGAGDLTASIDQSVEAELQAAVSQGKSVYVYPKTATIQASDDKVFGVSVLNLLNDVGTSNKCWINVSYSKYQDKDLVIKVLSTIAPNTKPNEWVLNPTVPNVGDPITKKESEIFPILIQPVKGHNAPDGTYIFDFTVYCQSPAWKQYGNTQKVYLTIT